METAKKSTAPLKAFNLNASVSEGRSEYLNRLVNELKLLMKRQAVEAAEGKRLNENPGGHENLDPDSNGRPVADHSVQTLIKPQLTNPKIFWSKSEDEDFCVDVKYNTGRCPPLAEKVTTNMFKPIRSEISPEPSKSGHRKVEDPEGSGKSIHESLRIQKVKRRTSLPYVKDEPPCEEVPQSFERVKTYDVSYYSSIMRRKAQESSAAADYYAMSRKKVVDQGLVKAASDECIYGERQPEVRYSNVKVYQRSRRSERLSVTEPSSPLSDHSAEIRKPGRSDSDMDSEGSTSDGPPVVVEMKKSKSFVDDKNADGYFKSKNYSKKSSTLEIRKPCYSSGSSCDSSAYRTRSLRRTKPKRRAAAPKESFVGSYPAPQSYLLCQVKPGQHWVESRPEREVRRRSGFEVSRERSQSWNRERGAGMGGVTLDGRQKMNADVFQYLLNVLMQKNRAEPLPCDRQESFSTKSLPRNRSRRPREMAYEQDYWRGAPGPSSSSSRPAENVMIDYSWGRNQRRKSETRKNTSTDSDSANQHDPKALERESYRVRRKADDMGGSMAGSMGGNMGGKTVLRFSLNPSMGEPAPAPSRYKAEKPMDTPSKRLPPNSRTIIESGPDGKDERIFAIEDENLWIELCKAVGKVDEKGRKAKKN